MATFSFYVLVIVGWVIFHGECAIHFPLYRRRGRLSTHDLANLTSLSYILAGAEAQYARYYRETEGNRLVRRWRSGETKDENDPYLINTAGRAGRWYTHLHVGDPPQTLEVDIDMLSPDFYTIMTTSGRGSKYDTFASRSHGHSGERVHPICRRPSDEFRFPSLNNAIRLDFPICNPSKASRQTLANSGTILGLSPHKSLARLSSPSLLSQLLDKKIVADNIWSVTILDADTGVLSLGGTIAREVEEAKIRGEIELKHFGDPVANAEWVTQQVKQQMSLVMPNDLPWDHHFKWTSVQGAAGWWTVLMKGVWINGAKILKNQPVVMDINVPFILAPPVAAQRFYDSIGGTERLEPPHDMFFAFPCLNGVNIAFEIGGWNFPVMSGEGTGEDALYGPAGGRFSLGKLGNGTGYCVGAVVETRMGVREQWLKSGMKDMWVLGEPFFRGLGVSFNVENGRVGVRTY